MGDQAAAAQAPQRQANPLIDRPQQIDPNQQANFGFANLRVAQNGQIQGNNQPAPQQVQEMRDQFIRYTNIQNAIVGRQQAPSRISSNSYNQQDMQTARQFNAVADNRLQNLRPFPAGLGQQPFFVQGISQELQQNGEMLRQMAMQVPPTQQNAILQQDRNFYQGVTGDFAANYLHIYNQRNRENNFYAFV